MSEISSGLVAVAWIAPDEDRFRVRICEDRPTDAPLWSPMCWVSDAEAIIAQKDAEILDQCRINGIGAEREASLLGQIERQSAALKLARVALMRSQFYMSKAIHAVEVKPRCDEAIVAIVKALKGRMKMERQPKKYVCEKCGYLGNTSEHEGCDYLAWTTGEQRYIDHFEAELAALRASPASAPEGWKHSCNALCIDGLELWIPQCPHCGKPAPTPPSTEDRKDAERLKGLRELCGYVEDGSSQTIMITQDDATKDWIIRWNDKAGWVFSSSFKGAIDEAMKGK